MKRVTSINDASSDASLVPSNGWIQMDLKWLVSDRNLGSKYLTFGRTVFAPGGSSKHALHRHTNAEEVLMVLRGHGNSRIGDDVLPMAPGDICYIPQGAKHSFENLSKDEECEIIFVYGGAPSLEKAGYETVQD